MNSTGMESGLSPSPVSSLIGIVTYLTEVELMRGAPDVFVSAARGPDMTVLGYPTGASVNGSGAGLTWDVACGAAVGECMERYSASIVNSEDLVIGSYASLLKSGRLAHSPTSWAIFDPTQEVPYPPFTADREIAWTAGWDLVTGAPVWVPACFAYLSSSPKLRESGASLVGPSVSTGCACSALASESVLKGLCELVERDAFMIVWRNRLCVPEIVIDEDTAIYETYLSRFLRPGLEYRLWQTTLDFSIPSFFGVLFDYRGPTTRMIVGGAANYDAEMAVQKTLCELVQGLSWLEHIGNRPSPNGIQFDAVRNFTDRAILYANTDLRAALSFLLDHHTPIRLSSIRSRPGSTEELLARCIQEMESKGLEPCAVDLTSDDVRSCGYVVTRAVVPGLETMDGDHRLQMLGGKRWRQVPVELGLRSKYTATEEINPFPHPYP